MYANSSRDRDLNEFWLGSSVIKETFDKISGFRAPLQEDPYIIQLLFLNMIIVQLVSFTSTNM